MTTAGKPNVSTGIDGALTIRPVQHFHVEVQDDMAASSELLSLLEELGVELLAFSAVPSASSRVQFTLVPEDPAKLLAEAARAQLPVEGPYSALLVQGDDHLHSLASLHRRALAANIDIYATGGVTDGRGAFAYMVYVGEDRFASAVEALTLEFDVD